MNNRQCVGARHSIVAKDGRILVLGIGGLVEIDPARLQSNQTPPLLSINSLQVDDSLHYAQAGLISPGDHRYIFDYSALSFVAPEKNQIRFRLIGQDKDWILSKGDNRAFYTNLAPGDYRFEIIASNNDGVWNNTPAVFSFTVKPFFYQTLWFKIVAVLLVLRRRLVTDLMENPCCKSKKYLVRKPGGTKNSRVEKFIGSTAVNSKAAYPVRKNGFLG